MGLCSRWLSPAAHFTVAKHGSSGEIQSDRRFNSRLGPRAIILCGYWRQARENCGGLFPPNRTVTPRHLLAGWLGSHNNHRAARLAVAQLRGLALCVVPRYGRFRVIDNQQIGVEGWRDLDQMP